MEFAEKLGAFYIGGKYDIERGERLPQPVIYDARDLTTHGVIVGMTGSGKTGLAIGILEEAALDKIPAIIIDPKGDMTNLLLTFPELRPEDFRPWINEDDARRKGMTPDEYAKKIAETWRKGLAEWGQGPDRIRRLKESVDWVIYTPGSEAGIPVNVLQSFKAPDLSWDTDEELIRERILGTVSAILGLLGIEADPVQSKEHVLLSNIFEYYWRRGEDLDLAKLIMAVQKPPFERLGVFDVETFFPEKERFALAMRMNNLLASPSFQTWLEGQPLDVSSFLYDETGKPRHSIFYIAHLSDEERMFFVTLLLEQVISWMRTQPGTTSLRALVYMDEVFGFFPPVAEPPSKRPMLTLLKQARAFGVGVLLATQNPVDLDYKGLTNAGTWFIGKLQTQRDKERLLAGLESVAGDKLGDIEKTISSLGSRVFLLHNVHDDETPYTFMTRWVMSYLRGPLTRAQIAKLMKDKKEKLLKGVSSAAVESGKVAVEEESTEKVEGFLDVPPAVAPSIDEVFIPVKVSKEQVLRETGAEDARLVYRPMIYATAIAHYYNSKAGVDEEKEISLLAPAPDGRSTRVDWDEAIEIDMGIEEMDDEPEEGALFEEIPPGLNSSKVFKKLEKSFRDYIYRNKTLKVYYNPVLKIYSKPGEDEREFKIRSQEIARELRDKEIDKLAAKFEKKKLALERKLARMERELEEDKAKYAALKRETYMSAGESILGFLLGRRSISAASKISRKHRMASRAKAEIEEDMQIIEQLKDEMQRLEEEIKAAAEEITQKWDRAVEEIQVKEIRPKKTDIDVLTVALAWAPYWMVEENGRRRFIRAF